MIKTTTFRLSIICNLLLITLLTFSCTTTKQNKRGINGSKEIVILSVNDMHANIDAFPKFANIVDSLRNIYPDMLIFSAGDNRTGNPINDQYPKHSNFPIIKLMNETGFDLSCLGNHEFDGNIEGLQYFTKNADFPIICANADFPDEYDLDIPPYIFIDNQGVKIGVIGLIEITDRGIPSAHPKNLNGVEFVQPIKEIQNYKNLDNQCDVLVLLSHCGFGTDTLIAHTFPEADVIIGGHSHTLIKEPKTYNGVLVTQSERNLRYTTLIKMTVKNGKVIDKEADVINIKTHSEKNEEIAKTVNKFNNNEKFKEIVGKAINPLDNKEVMGSFICDAIKHETNADFAFQNYGGVRVERWDAGDITLKQVYELDPFGNEIVTFDMTSNQIYDFIKAATISDNSSVFVSGLIYTMIIDENDSIISLNVTFPDGKPLDNNRLYKVAMNSYMSSTIQFNWPDNKKEIDKTTSDAEINFLKDVQEIDYKDVKRVTLIEK